MSGQMGREGWDSCPLPARRVLLSLQIPDPSEVTIYKRRSLPMRQREPKQLQSKKFRGACQKMGTEHLKILPRVTPPQA